MKSVPLVLIITETILSWNRAKVAGIFEEYVLLAGKESHKSTSSCRHQEHTYFLIALSFSFASEKGIPCQRQWHSTARRIHYYRRNTETEQLSDSFFLFLYFLPWTQLHVHVLLSRNSRICFCILSILLDCDCYMTVYCYGSSLILKYYPVPPCTEKL